MLDRSAWRSSKKRNGLRHTSQMPDSMIISAIQFSIILFFSSSSSYRFHNLFTETWQSLLVVCRAMHCGTGATQCYVLLPRNIDFLGKKSFAVAPAVQRTAHGNNNSNTSSNDHSVLLLHHCFELWIYHRHNPILIGFTQRGRQFDFLSRCKHSN